MNIEVKLFFDLAEHLPLGSKNKKVYISLQEGSTIQRLLDQLGLPSKMSKIVLLNGIKPKNGEKLKEGDVVAIFPPMAGG
ncbi:MAG: MoaD/ThiS family protein [Pseudomonadota bacterium]